MRAAVLVLGCCGLGQAGWLPAQAAPDTARPRRLEPVVVTAERAPSSLRSVTMAVTRIGRDQLERLPRATLADLLRLAPGFSVVDFDGMGFDPQVMVRGFYGGGEAEYVVVLVDGVPVNRLESGTVAWDALPPARTIEAIEVVRGGSSSLYGDAAIGGVINVITGGQAVGRSGAQGEAAAGSYGTVRAQAVAGLGGLWAGGALERTGGWREHAGRTVARVRGSMPFLDRAGATARVGVSAAWRAVRDPGPLADSLLALDRRSSDPLFRFDRTSERTAAAQGDLSLTRWGGRLTARVQGELRESETIRTLALAPGFGDTKERLATTGRLWGLAQFERALPGRGRLVVGIEGGMGRLHSSYYPYFGGTRSEYRAGIGTRGDLDTEGSARRLFAAAFGLYLMEAGPARLSAGFRWDGLRDRFDPEVPPELRVRRGHQGLSPRAGLNLRYADGEASSTSGNAYVAVSRSFKAPTLDQLFDRRRIPVPYPPYQITTSNPFLDPQRGTNLEAGLYHDFGWTVWRASLAVSAYRTAMTDELDFDLESFRYVNIGKSRHQGLEAEARVAGSWGSASAAYTLQDARARSGERSGKRLKAIPRHTLAAGLSIQFPALDPLTVSGVVSGAWGVYLDDANTRPLPGYVRVDLRLAARVRGLVLFGDLRNLAGARYSTTGFLDPSGSGQAYFHPAAGRIVEIGIASGT